MTVGPIEIFVIAFKDPQFHGEIRAELERLRDGEIIRVVDLLAVRKTEDGVIEAIQRSDLDADEAIAFGAAVGALIGLGAGGEDGMELGAVWGMRELADGHIFDDEDKWRVADSIQSGEGALIALVEHRWAIPVREAVRRAGGTAVAARWIADSDFVRLGESSIRVSLRPHPQSPRQRAGEAEPHPGGPMPLNDFQQELCTTSTWDFTDLRALYVNCTLKPSPAISNTQGLMDISIAIMEANGVSRRPVPRRRPRPRARRLSGHDRARRHDDDWPMLYERVAAADILVIGTPIWLGEKSSVCTRVIERLYGNSSQLNEHGQYAYYGKVGGCLVTGNEDGVKHCAMNVLYSLQHLGYVIPPQADAGWIGEAGPGPSYLDDGSGGPENDFTNRNTTFMTWNLLHVARMLKDAGGFPAHGNQRTLWDAGCRFDFPNPEYR